MSFPYNRVESWLGIGCDGSKEWVYFGFNTAPNLSNDETKSGYSITKARTKWDDSVENATLTQQWGAKSLHFQYSDWAISKIAESSSVLLELNWHGEQPSHIEYSLNGSTKALADIRELCANF